MESSLSQILFNLCHQLNFHMENILNKFLKSTRNSKPRAALDRLASESSFVHASVEQTISPWT